MHKDKRKLTFNEIRVIFKVPTNSYFLTNEIDIEFLINEFKKLLALHQAFTVFYTAE